MKRKMKMGGKGSGPKPKAKRLTERIEAALQDAGEDQGVLDEVISGEEAEVYDKYNRIRQKLGGTEAGKVKIKRWLKDGTLATLPSLPFEGFDEDVLAQHYGGGKYVLTFYKGDEYLGSDIVTLDPSIKPGGLGDAETPAIARTGLGPEAAMMMGQMEGFKALIQSQGVMMEGLLKALATGRTADAANGKDPLDVGLRIAEIINRRGAGDGPSVKELVGDMAETFREGIKFGQLAHTPAEKGLGDVIEPLIPAVGRALEAAASQGKVLPMQPRASRAAPQPEATVDLSKAPWLAHLNPFINEIATWARAGWNPEAYVTSMVARLPDHVLDEIFEAGKSPTFIDDALASMPVPFMAYKAWLTKALTSLREQVQPEETGGPGEEEDDDEDGQG
jgi:hypothetical protein